MHPPLSPVRCSLPCTAAFEEVPVYEIPYPNPPTHRPLSLLLPDVAKSWQATGQHHASGTWPTCFILSNRHHMFTPHPACRVAYNIPFALELRGTLRINALTTALQQLVDRHDALRSHFVFKDEVRGLLAGCSHNRQTA